MTIRVGIVGTGFGARVHLPVLKQHPEYDVQAVCSVRPGRAQEVAANFGIPFAFDDWADMLAAQDLKLDLVVVASAPAFHKSMAVQALAAGIHVLVEKPPALNYQEALDIQAATLESEKLVSMNFEWRYLPERQAVKDILSRGVLGEIFHVNWSSVWPMWPQLRDRENSWLWQAHEGGGLLGAIGSHMLDALGFWFGPLTDLQGMTTNHVPERRSGQGFVATTADDSFVFQGRFKTGGTCSVQFNVAAVGREDQIEVFGSQGTMVLKGSQLEIATSVAPEYTVVPIPNRMDVSGFDASIHSFVHPQWQLYSDLAVAIRGGIPDTLPTMQDVVQVQAALDAIRKTPEKPAQP